MHEQEKERIELEQRKEELRSNEFEIMMDLLRQKYQALRQANNKLVQFKSDGN